MFLQITLLKFNLIRMSAFCLFFSLMTFNSHAQNKADQVQIPDISIDRIEKMIDVGGRKLHCFIYGKDS